MPNSTTVPPRLSVIVPCYNEERRLPASLVRMQEFLEGFRHPYELLIVDDGSQDGTVALVRNAMRSNPNIRLLQYPNGQGNQGKGAAVQYGMLQARGEWVLFSDADLSTPMRELEKFLPLLDQGYDVVIASRALKESELKVRQPWVRERVGRVMNLLIRTVGGLPFPDTQCGFKLFSGRAARDIFTNLSVKGWMFDVEALVLAQKLGYRIIDQPVTWVNSDESRVKLSHATKTLRELVHIRLHWLRRRPERRTEVVVQTAP